MKAKATLMPHLCGMMINDKNTPCFVQAVYMGQFEKGKVQLTAKQLKSSLQKVD